MNETTYRAVASPGGVPAGARIASSPTLEEGYLAFMVARGRAEALVTDEHFGENEGATTSGEEARP